MNTRHNSASLATDCQHPIKGLMASFLAVWLALAACGDAATRSDDGEAARPQRPNLLLIVADDLNWDTPGAYGGKVGNATPNIDRLASSGMRFEHAHVTVAACQPSRNVLLTGRYAHRCGGEGFHTLRVPNVPLLPDVLRDSGYRVGAMGKLKHSTPYKDFEWDFSTSRADLGMGRNPQLFAKYAQQFIEESKQAGAPFFLMANSHDPHRPFFGADPESFYDDKGPPALPPSMLFTAAQCPIPGFLPALSAVTQEITGYYNSVRRLDDTVGGLLEVLDRTGVVDQTVVVFLSDNGMSFPFAKASCYLNGTRTPWIVRWPGQVAENSVCESEMISGVDLMPTLLEIAGVEAPEQMDGRSTVQLLRGGTQAGREMVFTQYGEKSSGESFPMRGVQSERYGYIFNLWSDGERIFLPGETATNQTFLAMGETAAQNPEIAARLQYLLKRAPEEFYDYRADPDGLNNLVDDPAYAEPLAEMRRAMESWMVTYEDANLGGFRLRDDPAAMSAYMDKHHSAGGQGE